MMKNLIKSKSAHTACWKNACTGFVSALALSAAVPVVFAQEVQNTGTDPASVEPIEDQVTQPTRIETADADVMIVTGSRIRRDEFNSIAPIQVIQGDLAREIGMLDATSLLQSGVQATGIQIDSTFNGFVLDNGPLATNVGLRGLGAARTLTLINSRRIGPGGSGGAPTAADLSLLPSIMIERVDILLDGASSVYGSDAVAGVTNIILRDDLDGIEFQLTRKERQHGGGAQTFLTTAWGKAFDRGNFGIALEYENRDALKYGDRHYSNCESFREIDRAGVIRSLDNSLVPGTTVNDCKLSTINRVLIGDNNPFGNVWYTPGTTNINIPNFSETTLPAGFAVYNSTINPTDVDGDGVADFGIIDPDGDGKTDVDLKGFYNMNGSPYDQEGYFSSPQERISLYSYGEYNLGKWDNMELFFEALYTNRKGEQFNPGALIFPDVPVTHPLNPCNQDAGGANCYGFFINPGSGQPFNFGNQLVTPILAVRGDREGFEVETNQYRFVGGAKGDISALEGSLGTGWTYEAFASYNRVEGYSETKGILGPNLTRSLETARIEDGTLLCGDGTADDDILGRGLSCVPVDLFADSLYQLGGGTFATQAETNYLFGSSSYDTTTEQTIISSVAQGDVFELSNGTSVPLVLGVEYRKDSVDTVVNDVAGNGWLFGYFADQGAKGTRNLLEVFAETAITPISERALAKDVTLEAAVRWTEESTFGAHMTYSLKGRYQPVDFLTFRGTYGTSFRAPNAREQFLAGRSGFSTVTDPCSVPTEARVSPVNPADPTTYDPTKDTRNGGVLTACSTAGVDPFTTGLNGTLPTYSVEVFTRGGEFVQSSIDPETSTSWTLGAVLDQTFTDAFDLRLSVTYYEIEIDNSITQLSTQALINRCYGSSLNTQNAEFFCNFLTRDDEGTLDEVDSTFFNVAKETSKGYDVNVYAEKEFVLNDNLLTTSVDVSLNKTSEILFQFDDSTSGTDSTGQIGAPEWNGNVNFIADYKEYRFQWFTRFIQGTEAPYFEDDWSDTGATCGFVTDQECRPFGTLDDYFVHSAAITWKPREDVTINFGIENVFDTEPQLLDDGIRSTTVVRGVPLGAGMDIYGRTFFVTARKDF